MSKKVQKKDQRTTMNRQAIESLLSSIGPVGGGSGRLERFFFSLGASAAFVGHQAFFNFGDHSDDEDDDDDYEDEDGDAFSPAVSFMNIVFQHMNDVHGETNSPTSSRRPSSGRMAVPADAATSSGLHAAGAPNGLFVGFSMETAINLADDDDSSGDDVEVLN